MDLAVPPLLWFQPSGGDRPGFLVPSFLPPGSQVVISHFIASVCSSVQWRQTIKVSWEFNEIWSPSFLCEHAWGVTAICHSINCSVHDLSGGFRVVALVQERRLQLQCCSMWMTLEVVVPTGLDCRGPPRALPAPRPICSQVGPGPAGWSQAEPSSSHLFLWSPGFFPRVSSASIFHQDDHMHRI